MCTCTIHNALQSVGGRTMVAPACYPRDTTLARQLEEAEQRNNDAFVLAQASKCAYVGASGYRLLL
jgi:hypothetical protein